MGTYEATNVVVARINKLDSENASKIIGHILVNLSDAELVRLASTPDYVLHNLVLGVKSHLGLFSSRSPSPRSPSPFNRIPNKPPRLRGGNHNLSSSPSSQPFTLPGFSNNPISPKSNLSLSLEGISQGSVSKSCLPPSPRVGGGGVDEYGVDEQQLISDYLSFLKDEELVDPVVESVGHRRSHSASDACFEVGEGMRTGYKPCLYFARGFCKNGGNCNFVHSDSLEGLEQHEHILRLKALHQQSLMEGASPSSYDKYISFLMQQRNDPQRFGGSKPHDFLGMASLERPNSPSRQIYLTFPAESTFKDEDVSEYFSKFGPVQDVRIPYQQKRMFGFVTFAYPETVRLILSKGNPHFVCDSRVLVKPYKEKGKIPDKRHQHQLPLFEMGELSPCLSPSGGIDSKSPHDFHLGPPRMFYDPQEILLRRKLEEEQAELQRAIELQERRLANLHLQLPDFKNGLRHHQRSLSYGASLPSSQLLSYASNPVLYSDNTKGDITGFGGDLVTTMSSAVAAADAEQEQSQQLVGSASIRDTFSTKGKGSANTEIMDLRFSVEHVLPDSLSASPTKAAGDKLSDFSTLPEVNESAVFSTCSSSQNKLGPQSALSDMASH